MPRVSDTRAPSSYEPVIPFKYSVTSYGADYPVDMLVNRMISGEIFVPEFQRGYVWNLRLASRFIESLLLGLPVPGIFLATDPKSRKLIVVDGQQRLRTLEYFVNGVFPQTEKRFRLRGVQQQFDGLTYTELPSADATELNNAIIHATIVKQDEPSDDQSSIFYIFERINTGGLQLTAQEIRSCLYFGRFTKLLQELNAVSEWRDIYGKINQRMRDQELILRFLALYYRSGKYKRPMKGFLNTFMADHREVSGQRSREFRDLFYRSVSFARTAIGKGVFRPQRNFNAAVFDSVMIGIARRLASGSIPRDTTVKDRYRALLRDNSFIDATSRATADEETLAERLNLATDAFAQ